MGVIIVKPQPEELIQFSELLIGDTFFVICDFKPIFYMKIGSETTATNAVNLETGNTAYFLARNEVRRVKIEGRVVE